jgi:hypothetical protein
MRWFVSWVLWTLVMWVALWLYIAWFLSIQRIIDDGEARGGWGRGADAAL